MIISNELDQIGFYTEKSIKVGLSALPYSPLYSLFTEKLYICLERLNNFKQGELKPLGSTIRDKSIKGYREEIWDYIFNSSHYYEINHRRLPRNNSKYAFESSLVPNGYFITTSLKRKIYNDDFFTYRNLILGNFYVATIKNNEVKTMMTLVIPREYLSYVKLCILTGNEIDNSAFEFWIDSSLFTTEVSIADKLVKTFVPCMMTNNIPVVIRDDIHSQFFLQYELPNMNSIMDYRNYTKEISTETMNDLKILCGFEVNATVTEKTDEALG